MIRMHIRVEIDRETLIWAAAYLLHHGEAHPYLMKRNLLEFLRGQIKQFGTHHDTLMGSNWEDDFEKEIPEATAWVDKRFGGKKS
jgi:hypothetical protein